MNPRKTAAPPADHSFSKRFRKAFARFGRRRLAVVGLIIVVVMVASAMLSNVLMTHDPLRPNPRTILKPPSASHYFGTDPLGRDIFSRTLLGGKVSLQVAGLAISGALIIGVAIGVTAGFRGGWVDEVVMRVMDTVMAFPTIILALAITAALGASLTNAMIAITIVNVPGFARLARAQVLNIRRLEFIEAARALGIQEARLIFRHILPNIAAPLIVHATLAVGHAIIVEASLSFLGLGIQPPHPSWGSMLRSGYTEIETAPWLSIFPGLAIFLTVLGFNLLGDGLRDAFDVKS